MTEASENMPKPTGIYAIPQDVLGYIFRLTLPPWDEPFPPAFYSDILVKNKPPWTITAVSQHWRSTALGEKTLWSILKINLVGLGPGFKLHNKINTLKLWLERSESAPLSIYFIDKVSESKDGPTPPLMQLLIDHSHRWSKFSTWLHSQHYDQLSTIRGKIPLLQELHITPYASNSLNTVTIFEDAPRLRIVKFPQINDMKLIKLPYHQFTSLDIQMKHSPWPPEFLHLTSSSLKELAFSNVYSTCGLPIHSPIEHTGIRHLTTDSLECLLSVKLPNLETLVIDHPSNPSKNTTTPIYIQLFASRDQLDKLTTLSLAAVRYRDSTSIWEMLRQLPHLTHLQIIERDPWQVPWDAIVPILTLDEENPLLPVLTYLDLQTRKTTLLLQSFESLLRMVASRLRYGSFAVRLIGQSHMRSLNMFEKEAKRLQELEKEGYDVTQEMVNVLTINSPSSPYHSNFAPRNNLQTLTMIHAMSGNRTAGTPKVFASTFLSPMLNW